MRAISVRPASSWSGDAADTVVLECDDRRRRRMAMTGTRGLAFVLDLPEPAWLRDGDALVLEDGRLVEVVAAPEPLLEIRCADALQLGRVAWYLGNRHLPAQILAKSIRVRRDHVVADMVVRLGARVVEIEAPFDPEGGAYAEASGEHHRHSHEHAHAGGGRGHSHGHGHHHHGHRHGR